jgi:hypothetical protein
MKKSLLVLVSIFVLSLLFSTNIYAETLSTQYIRGEININTGDILSLNKGKVYKANHNNISSIIGVATQQNTLFNYNNNYVNVLEKGVENVYVSNLNGNISSGQYITVSNIKGVGSLLINKGISVGKALSSFNIKNAHKYKNTNIYIEKIPVSINVSYINNIPSTKNISPISYIEGGVTVSSLNLPFYKLLIIFILLSSTVFIAMIIIIRVSRNTIMKTARNPLNKDAIIKNFYKIVGLSLLIIFIGILSVYLTVVL